MRVDYDGLQYRYKNIEEETQKEIKCRKSMINPEILFNPKISLEEILGLPEIKNFNEEQIKHLKENVEDIRGKYKSRSVNHDFEIKVLEDVKKDLQKDYNETKTLSEKALYEKIKKDFEHKNKYKPKSVPKVTPYDLERAGYLVGLREFSSIENAMHELYSFWEDISNDAVWEEKEDVLENAWRGEAFILDKAVKFFNYKNKI